jgi:hypothetical protein
MEYVKNQYINNFLEEHGVYPRFECRDGTCAYAANEKFRRAMELF